MKLGNVFLAIVAGFFALFVFGSCWSMKIDAARPRDTDPYSYYMQRLSEAEGDELEEADLAVEFLDMLGEFTEKQHNDLNTIYQSRKGE